MQFCFIFKKSAYDQLNATNMAYRSPIVFINMNFLTILLTMRVKITLECILRKFCSTVDQLDVQEYFGKEIVNKRGGASVSFYLFFK